MTDTPDILQQPPAEMRAYASGLRAARRAVASVNPFAMPVALQALEREATMIEGFAARLASASPAPEEQRKPVTAERVAEWMARFESAALRTTPQPAQPVSVCAAWDMQCRAGCEAATSGQCVRDHEASIHAAVNVGVATAPTPEEATQSGLADAVAEATPKRTDTPAANEARRETIPGAYPLEVVQEARRLFVEEHISYAEIGRRLDIPTGTISGWATKRGWIDAREERPAEEAPPRQDIAAQPGTDCTPFSSVWNPARLELLHAEYATADLEDLLQRVNAIEGLNPCASVDALREKATKLGLRRRLGVASTARRDGAKKLFVEGLHPAEISRLLDIPRGSINAWASMHGWRQERDAMASGDPAAAEPVRDAEPPKPPRHAHGLSENGGKPGTWTSEREGLLRRLYPSTMPVEEIFQELNLLPGPPVASLGATLAQAKKLGLTRKQPPRLDDAIPPPKGTEPPPMTTEDKAEAREMLRKGKLKGARDVMEFFGCTQAEALDLLDAHRANMGKAA